MDYKKMLFELLESIENVDFFEYIYTFTHRFKENWEKWEKLSKKKL